MSKNAGKYFLKGFQPNFENSYSNSYKYGMRQKENEYNLEQKRLEEEQKRLEEEKKNKEWNDAKNIMDRLYNGRQVNVNPPLDPNKKDGENVFPKFKNVPYTPEEVRSELLNLKSEHLSRYKTINDLTKPEQQKYVYKENSPTAFIEGKDGRLTPTEEPNPTYKKKIKTTMTGEINGKKATQITYDDNTTEIVDSPFSSGDKRVKRTAVDNNLKVIKRINTLKEQYLSQEPKDENVRRYINTLTNETREKVYLQFNDLQKEFIDSRYNKLKNTYKTKGYNSLEDFESATQDVIREDTNEAIYDAVDNNDIEWEDAQGLINYFDLKYGYLKE